MVKFTLGLVYIVAGFCAAHGQLITSRRVALCIPTTKCIYHGRGDASQHKAGVMTENQQLWSALSVPKCGQDSYIAYRARFGLLWNGLGQ